MRGGGSENGRGVFIEERERGQKELPYLAISEMNSFYLEMF